MSGRVCENAQHPFLTVSGSGTSQKSNNYLLRLLRPYVHDHQGMANLNSMSRCGFRYLTTKNQNRRAASWSHRQ